MKEDWWILGNKNLIWKDEILWMEKDFEMKEFLPGNSSYKSVL